jgi:hypothetical protein
MSQKRLAVRLTAVVGVLLLAWALPTLSNHGYYHADRTWSSIYHQHVFTTEQARAMGYVGDEECVPGMGYHWIRPSEAEAWFQGHAGGMQVLLFDKTGYLVGIEYMFTAPSLDAPAVLGMSGPMEGHLAGMPVHYDQHIYFREPICP